MGRMARPPYDLAPGRARPARARADAPGDRVPVGPGRPVDGQGRPVDGEGAPHPVEVSVSDLDVFGFPVQIGKVQPPFLPVETLERQRLLGWMTAKIHSRLVLIVADAGYGKTTLLADWSRRTRLRTLWYRLDEADRDWVVFVNHVVAAGREIDPSFAPNTMSLIRELGAGMGDRGAIVRTLLAEIRTWVTGATALLLDDYQVVDDVPEVREIVRELLVRGPERLTLVISTRRAPTLPLARLRALGEVAELGTTDLRFDRGEMERLFRETYRHPLEPDLLEDLARTTEGWAATLRLVETAVRGRPRDEIRAVIRGLSARHGDLHDYLAEEVVGRMPLEMQDFLERCALLQVATPQLAAVAADVSLADARHLLDITEEAGLLSRRGRTGQAGRLLHPLVRSFLEGRLLEAVGPVGIAEIHARIAATAEANSWWLAGHHYAAAGRAEDVARVLSGSLEEILGAGGAQAAVDLIASGGVPDQGGWAQALAARSFLREGDIDRAREAAQRALAASTQGDPTISLTVALATLTTVEWNTGEYVGAVEAASALRDIATDPVYAAIAAACLAGAASMVDGQIPVADAEFATVADRAQRLGHLHYFGISHLNLAWIARGLGDPRRTLDHAGVSLEALAATSAGPEMDTVRTVAAWAHAHLGDAGAALSEIEAALASPFAQNRFETLLEAADVVGAYVDPDRGRALLAEAEAVGARTAAEHTYLALFRAETLIRLGRPSEATATLDGIASGRHTGYPGFYVRVKVAQAVAAVVARSDDADRLIEEARGQATTQGAAGALRSIQLLACLQGDPVDGSSCVTALWSVEPGIVVALAEAILSRLGQLDDTALEVILQAASRQPRRWLLGLRGVVDAGAARDRWAAGRILDAVGEKSDVRRLRALSRELKGSVPFTVPRARAGAADGRPGVGGGPGPGHRPDRRPCHSRHGDAAEAACPPLLPPQPAGDVGHARPGPRRPVAGHRPRPGRQLAPPDGLLPSAGHRARVLGRPVARLRQPGHRARLARSRADRQPQRAVPGAGASPRHRSGVPRGDGARSGVPRQVRPRLLLRRLGVDPPRVAPRAIPRGDGAGDRDEHGGRALRRGDGAVPVRPRDGPDARPDRGQPREDVPAPRSTRRGRRAVPALHVVHARRARARAAPT